MQKITTFLWFDNQAEEAMNLYVSLFKNSKVSSVSRYGEGAPLPAGTVMSCNFSLAGQEFMALNGGPHHKFNEAISLFVSCENQQEIDYFWDGLIKGGGEESMCGWLKDKFGLSWQIIPTILGELIGDPNPAKSGPALQAMFKMHKLDIKVLKDAHDGK